MSELNGSDNPTIRVPLGSGNVGTRPSGNDGTIDVAVMFEGEDGEMLIGIYELPLEVWAGVQEDGYIDITAIESTEEEQ